MRKHGERLELTRSALVTMLLVTLLAPNILFAGDCTAASGNQRVALLELYTSEGCDSCPPADRWVGELPARNFRGDRVVPLAFHVDYWNQLGWIDPFSQASFSVRQRQQSNRRGLNFVVTPQLLLNGQDFRRGAGFDDFAAKIKTIGASRPSADIRLTLRSSASALLTAVEVQVTDASLRQGAHAYLALYEMNLATAVPAGENKGKTLRHHFVVRTLVGPLQFDGNGNLNRAHRFELDPQWKSGDLHLAAFVQNSRNGDVLQALSAHCN
jgi:hypothetical protein